MQIKSWLLLTGFMFASGTVYADSSCDVKVDCETHKLSIHGQEGKISCGGGNAKNCASQGNPSADGRTATCKGKVGGPHNGDVVKNGVEIDDCAGMGNLGGGKVFHVGGVDKDTSCGCIHVTPEELSKLKSCQGSVLDIKGNGGAANGAADQGGNQGGGGSGTGR